MKQKCRTNVQSGRSMIEMLGVLAIIGVLSVGGIAGYSKAMFKYKLNIQKQQMSQIFQGITQYQRLIKEVDDNKELIPIYKTLNIIPQEMLTEEEYYITDALGVRSHILSFTDQTSKIAYWYFNLMHIDNKKQICINIFQTAQKYYNTISGIGIVQSENNQSASHYFFGKTTCHQKTSKQCIQNMTLTDLLNVCNLCIYDNCRLSINFRPGSFSY